MSFLQFSGCVVLIRLICLEVSQYCLTVPMYHMKFWPPFIQSLVAYLIPQCGAVALF